MGVRNISNSKTIQSKNYKIQKCDNCKKLIHISVGDILYGDKWYHDYCWKQKHQ